MHYTARGKIDLLVRSIAKTNTGFNKKPFKYTLVIILDLTSVFNHAKHNKLLQIIIKLQLPTCYIKFYKGFLNDRWF